MSYQKDRLQNKNYEDDQIRIQLKEKTNELSKYVTEVQMLSSQNAKMADEIDSMTQELEATLEEIERYHSQT